jgi:hypothetical protein
MTIGGWSTARSASYIRAAAAPLNNRKEEEMNEAKDCEQAQGSREMPRYKCHKEAWALKIAAIDQAPADQEKVCALGDWYITPADEGYGRVLVGHDFVLKHNPQVGGYYVVYDDGYKSYSPAAPFEAGYSRIGA